jgi:hypothetical protein
MRRQSGLVNWVSRDCHDAGSPSSPCETNSGSIPVTLEEDTVTRRAVGYGELIKIPSKSLIEL